MPDRLCGLVDRIQPGNHDPGGPLVQDAADADAVSGFDPDDRRDAVAAGGNDAVADRIFSSGAVFEVDQHPVGAGRRTDFGGSGR
ncbi:hypothetical protein ABH915_003973 [Arthrobacter sp. MW3 TE3886]